MTLRRFMLTTFLATAVSLPAYAAINFDLDIVTAPPAPRYEVVPEPRPGYVWAPGYWAWRGNRHEWVPGYWIEEQRGMIWVADRWEPHEGGHWRHIPGHWEHPHPWEHDHWRH
jgi:hypothetical protein